MKNKCLVLLLSLLVAGCARDTVLGIVDRQDSGTVLAKSMKPNGVYVVDVDYPDKQETTGFAVSKSVFDSLNIGDPVTLAKK